ncbi:MAG: hypothetical protein JWP75_2924 [Frondihabitans sp.]|nr:hypothetical protein [Frondihabitans sp.]
MSIAPNERPELAFDLADRMRKALRIADIGVAEMADYLDVSRNAAGSWINGRIKPKRQTLILWAMRTGVPLEWLTNGETPPAGTEGVSDDAVVRPKGLEPPTF